MATTPWIDPTSVGGFTTGFTNPSNAFTSDSQYATSPRVNEPWSLYIVRWDSSGGWVVAGRPIDMSGPSSITATRTISSGVSIADLRAGNIGLYVGNSTADYSLDLRGYDFSSVPVDATLVNFRASIKYVWDASTLYVDTMEAQLDYNITSTSATATSISSVETFNTPIVTPDPVYASAPSITSAETFGSALLTMSASISTGITSTEAFDTATSTLGAPPPPPPTDWEAIGKEDDKTYIYKVFDQSGTYIGIWNDVSDRPQFTQQINTPGTTMTVRLARSARTTKEVRASLKTQGGDYITTEDGNHLVVSYQTNNTVGEGTDVDLKYRVDVYVQYGEFGRLLTQAGEPITTEDGNYLMVAIGAPMGVRIFSGFILDYSASYSADSSGVTVTLASDGYELSNEIVRSGETTTVTYSSSEIGSTVKSILDTNPGMMTYDASSIGNTATTTTSTFKLNTKLEAIQSLFQQTPDNWYWFGNPADRLLYLQQASTTPKHVFYLGTHIKSIDIKRSIEGLINRVYFVGGQTTPNDNTTTVYKKYEDTTSQTSWGVGLERITDRRYTLAASMQKRANKDMGRYKVPIFTTPVTISSARYDLESIKLGDMVGFANFGNFIDSLVLQIVSLSYTPTAVTIQLGELQQRQVDLLADVQDDLQNDQYSTIPNAPS